MGRKDKGVKLVKDCKIVVKNHIKFIAPRCKYVSRNIDGRGN